MFSEKWKKSMQESEWMPLNTTLISLKNSVDLTVMTNCRSLLIPQLIMLSAYQLLPNQLWSWSRSKFQLRLLNRLNQLDLLSNSCLWKELKLHLLFWISILNLSLHLGELWKTNPSHHIKASLSLKSTLKARRTLPSLNRWHLKQLSRWLMWRWKIFESKWRMMSWFSRASTCLGFSVVTFLSHKEILFRSKEHLYFQSRWLLSERWQQLLGQNIDYLS